MRALHHTLLTSTFLALLLSGCIEGPPKPVDPSNDADGDGVIASEDCDDANRQVYPGAREACDGVDNDCNGKVDDAAVVVGYEDSDGDGYGNPDVWFEGCEAPKGVVDNSGDCDDSNADIHPMTRWFVDSDGDGHGSASGWVVQCEQPANAAAALDDCNDSNANIHPGADEVCNGADDDCDGLVDDDDDSVSQLLSFYSDVDKDTFGDPTTEILACARPTDAVRNGDDCNDLNVDVHPAATEDCGTSIDDNCDGNDNDADAIGCVDYYADADGDDYGGDDVLCLCVADATHTITTGGDCDDTDATVNPDKIWYADSDGDGYGAGPWTLASCTQPSNYVDNIDDCDDGDADVHPLATDWCDGIDQDCDGYFYTADFDTGASIEWSFTGTSTNSAASPYLGTFGADGGAVPQAVVLNLGTLPAGDYTLQFELLWFGTTENEAWEVRQGVNGSALYSRTLPPANSGLNDVRSVLVTHSGGNLSFEFVGWLDEANTDEWWGLDDVLVTNWLYDEDQSIQVESDPTTLHTDAQTAVDAATAGDTVNFCAGPYGAITVAVDDLTLNGPRLGTRPVFDGGATRSVIRVTSTDVDQFSLSNARLTNGQDTDGAGIFLGNNPNRVVTLDSLEIDNNVVTADGGGGGLFMDNNTVTVTDSVIHDNTAADGGGVHIVGGNLTMNNVDIWGNSSTNLGAGVFILDGSVDGGTIYENTSLGGGGIGGAGTVTLVNVNVSDNTATDGAGLYLASGRLTWGSSTYDTNIATGAGGGVFLGSSVTATRSPAHAIVVVANNRASAGGGVYLDGGATLGRATVEFNTATSDGGGVWSGQNDTINSTTIANNSAIRGGGIFTAGNLSIGNANISSNDASQGGGLFDVGGGVSISSTSIVGNVATTEAGGARLGSGAVLTDAYFDNNEALSGGGGAVYVVGSLVCDFADFVGNSATNGGAVFLDDRSSPIFDCQNSTWMANSPEDIFLSGGWMAPPFGRVDVFCDNATGCNFF